MRLSNDKMPGDLKVDPPVLSSTLRIDVESFYTKSRNGFAAIRIWKESGVFVKLHTE